MSLAPRTGVAGDDGVGQGGRADEAMGTLIQQASGREAELPLRVQAVRLAVPEFHTPPPSPAELPLTVQSVRLAVP